MFCPKESLSLKLGCWCILLEDWSVCTRCGSREGPHGRLELRGETEVGIEAEEERVDANRHEQV